MLPLTFEQLSPQRLIVIMKHIFLLAALSLAISLPARAQGNQQKPVPQAATPVELGKFAAWTAYAFQGPGGKQCYLVGAPQASEPKDRVPGSKARDATNLFIAHRPAQNVRNEVFVSIGYAFKDKANATVEISGQAAIKRFPLFTRDQGAWLLNAAEETQFVEVVRKGKELKVRGTSLRGTNTVDTYALAGISDALARITQECK